MRPEAIHGSVWLVVGVLALGVILCGLSGRRDLVGDTMYQDVGGYSVCAWTMLIAFATVAIVAGDDWPSIEGQC